MSSILPTTKRCSSLLIRLSTNTTNSKSHGKELVSRRLMSSKRQRRQQQQQQQQQRRPNPQANPPPPPSPQQQQQRKWPLMLSIMTVPIMFLGWAASDSIFGNRQIGQNERLRQEFLQSSSSLVDEESTPILSYCVVRRAWGVTHCLTSVQLGDVVEVLQEGVGPNRAYNLCRLPADPNEPLSTDIYGWFPTRWLQKLEDYDKMVQEQWERLETQDKS